MKRLLLALLALAVCLPAGRCEALTIALRQVTVGNAERERCEYASSLMSEAGFDVEFTVIEGAVYDYALENYGDDIVYVTTASETEELLDAGAAEESAPLFERAPVLNRLAVLIRNDVFEAWGDEVRGAEALENLMYYLADGDSAPCAASPMIYDRMYNRYGFLAMRLCLPEYGWYSLSGALDGACFYASLEDDAVCSLYDLPGLDDLIAHTLELVNGGLLDLYIPRPKGVTLDGYPLIIVNTEDFLAPLMLANNPPLAAVDMSEYTLQVLYPDVLPEIDDLTRASSAYEASGTARAVARFEEFLDWLGDEENYMLLRYGREGADYSLEGDVLTPLDTELRYQQWEQSEFFASDALDKRVYNARFPENLAEELALISYPRESELSEDASEEAREFLREEGLTEQILALIGETRAFLEQVYVRPSAYDENSAYEWISAFQRENPLSEAADYIGRLMQED